ncbi:expressed unknown protein [Seminavis robusta]|uniref:Uncharacterized protein n=1 Tax=Seminavis robusta TaxID=568900 RepID=A0A9N8HUK9_9STRA|nr:expressed unknown protein [Seminavis robusta]|eukprot:Sro1836_g300640.1 n/a (467) ;mRNA; r:6359-7759
MGSSSSKTVSKETPEQRQERFIRQQGVLIPPVFAVVNNQDKSGSKAASLLQHRLSPISAYDRLPISPSLVEYLCVSHVGHGLLHDFMTPGMWVLAGNSSANNNGSSTTVRASLPLQATSSGGRISFGSTAGSSQVELCAGTEGPMHLFATHQVTPQSFLVGNVNTHGAGYVGGQLGFSFAKSSSSNAAAKVSIDDQEYDDWNHLDNSNSLDDRIQVQLGSWVPLRWKSQKSTPYPTRQRNNHNTNWPKVVHGCLSIDMLGSTTALETKFNTQTLETQVSKYFSMQLDGGSNNHNNNTTPPLWLTMTSTPQTATIHVSQLLTLDRLNFNVLDTRAPRVRNTVGWTVQLETKPNDASSSLSVAGVWQCNRAVAVKVVGTSQSSSSSAQQQQPNNYSMTYGLLMKRWKQPRMTCSLLGRFDFQTKKSTFLGIGLEVETDALGGDDSLYAPGGESAQVPDDTPETKASLG